MKLFFSSLLCLSLVLSANNLKAQGGHCGSDERLAEILKTNPEVLKSLTEYSDIISRAGDQSSKLYKKGATRTIPVVFHIIHMYGAENITKEQIEDQMRVINEDFQRLNADSSKTRAIFKGVAADMDIEFKLARKDPNGNCTEGITRTFSALTDGGDDEVKNLIRWDYKKYLNIWVVKNIALNVTGGKTLGYAVFPFSTNSREDGIVILADYVGSIGTAVSSGNKGRVLGHEAGHWLGLFHPFQGNCGGNCSNSGDYVCDTPPVTDPSFGCPSTNNTCTNDFPNDQLDMIENYMDYANGSCQNLFTKGQKAVVEAVLANSNYTRASNISPAVHTSTGIFTNPSCSAIADFNTANNILTICQGGKVLFKDYSYNGAIATYAWSFDGGFPATSAKTTPDSVLYNTAGLYKVTLTVTNAQGTNTKTVDKMINVVPSVSGNKTPVSEGFESGTVLTNSWNVLESGEFGWKRTTTRKYEGVAGMYAYINEGAATNASYNLVSAAYDLSVLKGRLPKLKFKVAYRPYETGNSELLYVWVSKNCGQNWNALKAYSSSTGLGVDKVVDPGWFPSSQADWQELKLDLSNYENTKNIMFKFDARSKGGNSIFLDNINIEADLPVGVVRPLDPDNLLISIHPNPSRGSVNIDFDSEGKSFEGVRIFNATGQEIENNLELIARDGEVIKYVFHPSSPGIYFAQFKIQGQIMVKKFIVTP